MANTFNTIKNAPGIISKLAAKRLVDNLQFCKTIDKADKSDFDGKNGYSSGETIYINKPARFIPTQSFDITSSIQDVKEEKVPLVLDTISSVAVDIDTFQFATEIQLKSIVERIVYPAVEAIAQDVEARFLRKAIEATPNVVGNPGSTQFDVDTILSAKELLDKGLCPKDNERYFLHDARASRLAVGARKGLFQSSSEIAKQYKMGYIGTADGFSWMQNELLPAITNGNDVTGVAVNTTLSTQGVSTVVFKGVDNPGGTFKKGQVFTIDGVFAVHPQTKQVYTYLQQFVITANVAGEAAATRTVTFSPAIYTTESLQNVSKFPTADDAIVFVGTASAALQQNLAYHKSAYRMVSVPLIMPVSAEVATQYSHEGITVALVRDFDIMQRRMITRLDFLGAITAVRPEHAVRIVA
jgi:hypothetical protein